MPKLSEPAEPAYVTEKFERCPAEAVREAQIRAITDAAEAGAASGLMDGLGRAALAVSAAAYVTGDQDLMDALGDVHCERLARIVDTPSRSWDDLTIKLATLVRLQCDLARDDSGALDRLEIGLAASVLADAVLLRGGPIAWPDGATEAATSPGAIAHWRRVATRAARAL